LCVNDNDEVEKNLCLFCNETFAAESMKPFNKGILISSMRNNPTNQQNTLKDF